MELCWKDQRRKHELDGRTANQTSDLALRVQGLTGCRIWELGFRAQVLQCRLWGAELRDSGAGAQGLEPEVSGFAKRFQATHQSALGMHD